MEPAGTIVTEQPPSDAAYRVCDGTYLVGAHYPDYHWRVGGTIGQAGIGLLRVPLAPGYSIRVADDPNAPDPPADGWSYTNLPPPYQLWINPVADAVADGTGTATVTAEAHITPITATCTASFASADGLATGPVEIELSPDGTMTLLASVPVGDPWHFALRVAARPEIVAISNDFKVTGA